MILSWASPFNPRFMVMTKSNWQHNRKVEEKYQGVKFRGQTTLYQYKHKSGCISLYKYFKYNRVV